MPSPLLNTVLGSGMPSLMNGLAEYFPMTEPSGNIVGLFGTVLTESGGVTSAPFKCGGGRRFTAASTQYASVADNALFSIGASMPFEFAGWVRPATVSGDMAVLGKWLAAGNFEYLLKYDNANSRWTSFGSTDGTATGEWYHAPAGAAVAGRDYFLNWGWDGANLFLGVNGIVEPGTGVNPIFNGASAFTFGRRESGTTNYLDGSLAHWGFWKGRILNPRERVYLFNGGAGRGFPF